MIKNQPDNHSDFVVLPAPDLEAPKISLPLMIEEKMNDIWLRLNRGMRWMIIDQLRRYDEYVDSFADKTYADGWARMRIKFGENIPSGGQVMIKLKGTLPSKKKAASPHFEISFIPETQKYPRIPEDVFASQKTKIRNTSVRNLIGMPLIDKKNKRPDPEGKDYEIDAIAERIIERIPANVREEVLDAIFTHRMDFRVSNATGEAGVEEKSGFGVDPYSTGKKKLLVPTGYITSDIYFQNGWLMVKLANFPEAFGLAIKNNEDAEKFFQVEATDGAGKSYPIFKDMKISRIMRGKTWMGSHLQIKFSKRENA